MATRYEKCQRDRVRKAADFSARWPVAGSSADFLMVFRAGRPAAGCPVRPAGACTPGSAAGGKISPAVVGFSPSTLRSVASPLLALAAIWEGSVRAAREPAGCIPSVFGRGLSADRTASCASVCAAGWGSACAVRYEEVWFMKACAHAAPAAPQQSRAPWGQPSHRIALHRGAS
jgi:hypothetical protein